MNTNDNGKKALKGRYKGDVFCSGKVKFRFRAKQIDTGEYVKGFLIADNVLVPLGERFYIKNNKLEGEITAYEIDPSSIQPYGIWS